MILPYIICGVCLLSFIIISLWLYTRQIRKLLQEIEQTQGRKLLPERWLMIAFMPILGYVFYQQAKDSLNDLLSLNLAIRRQSILKPIFFVGSKWVLFQELYDRKTSMYHGTQMNFLNAKNHYQFVASPNKIVPANFIHVEVARKPREISPWALLMYQAPNWKLANSRAEVVIPIIKSIEGVNTVTVCRPSEARILNGGEKFIVGLSKYEILKLPLLFLRWIEGEIIKDTPLTERTIIWPFPANAGFEASKSDWKIADHILNVYKTIEYTRVTSRRTIRLEFGDKIPVMPGDSYKVVDSEIQFWIESKNN